MGRWDDDGPTEVVGALESPSAASGGSARHSDVISCFKRLGRASGRPYADLCHEAALGRHVREMKKAGIDYETQLQMVEEFWRGVGTKRYSTQKGPWRAFIYFRQQLLEAVMTAGPTTREASAWD